MERLNQTNSHVQKGITALKVFFLKHKLMTHKNINCTCVKGFI